MAKFVRNHAARTATGNHAPVAGVLLRFLLVLGLVSSTGCLRSFTETFQKKELPVVEAKPKPKVESKDALVAIENALRTNDVAKKGGPPVPIDGWYRKLGIDIATPLLPGEFRWQHKALADYLKEPSQDPKQNPQVIVKRDPKETVAALKRALRSEDQFVAATAAIALARLQPQAPIAPLVKVVRNRTLTPNVRCAAIETLAREQSIENEGQLRTLLEQYGPTREGKLPAPELYPELLIGLARHVEVGQEPVFAEALLLNDLDVQVSVLKVFAAAKERNLPQEVQELVRSPNARLRSAALQALVAAGDDAAFTEIEKSLRDQDLSVRLEAIALLGQLDNRESLNLLYELLDDEADLEREKATESLVARREWAGVERAARDKSFRVRQAVAAGLREHAARERVELAQSLLNDSSAMVQAKMAESLVGWPEELSGPLLVAAMGSNNYLTRVAAIKSLSASWPSAKELDPSADAVERAQVLSRLTQRWRSEHPQNEILAPVKGTASAATLTAGELAEFERLLKRYQQPPGSSERWLAQKQLEERRRNLLPALDQLVAAKKIKLDETIYRDLLPAASETMATVEKLRSADVNERRAASRKLAASAGKEPLAALALGRIEQLARAETDPQVWTDLLRAAGECPSYVAHELASAALGQGEADVRRRGCEYLAKRGDARQSTALVKLLQDNDLVVKKNAIAALERCGPAEEREQLYAFLVASDVYLQVAAAKTLSKWNDERGRAALERLALDQNPGTRRLALLAMGELQSGDFLPALMQALDDEPSVRLAALTALPKAAQEDALAGHVPAPVSAIDKAKAWQAWYEKRVR